MQIAQFICIASLNWLGTTWLRTGHIQVSGFLAAHWLWYLSELKSSISGILKFQNYLLRLQIPDQ